MGICNSLWYNDSMRTFTALHGTIPVLLHVPHAGLESFLDSSDIETGAIAKEMNTMADLNTDWIARLASSSMNGNPYLLQSHMTRMECDVERYPDDREEMNKVGMGVIYSLGMQGADDSLYTEKPPKGVVDHRLGALYKPYHRMFGSMVREMVGRFGFAVIIDVHSYAKDPLPYELHSDADRPEICIGVNNDADESMVRDIISGGEKHGRRWSYGFNTVFRGAITPEGMGDDPRVHSVMLEFRKDTYMSGGIPMYADMDALGEVISRLSSEMTRTLSSVKA